MAHPTNSPRGLFAKNVMMLNPVSAVPSVRYGPGAFVYVSNSTGSMLALNTTGTTWTYLNVTSELA